MTEAPTIILTELVEYLDNNRHLLENSHNRYTVEGLMLMLDSPKLHRLEKEFKLYPNGLELPVFLFTMQEIFQEDCKGDQKYELVDGLVSLFQSIDIDGDGHLLWQEFTEYIIEAIKKLDHPGQQREQRQIIETAYSKLGREYKLERTAELNLANAISKLVYVEQLEGYLSLENNSTAIKVYDMHFTVKETLQFPASKWYYYLQDFAVDEEGMMLTALLPDGAYFLPLKYRPGRCVLPCRDIELLNFSSVWWLPGHRYWAFGSSAGELKICSVLNRSRSAIECSLIYQKRHHAQTITMLKEINQPEMLCSCSLDGTVKLLSLNSLKVCVFDELERKPAVEIRGKRGYLGFDYSCEFGRVVMLYGFSNSIALHSLDLSLTKGFAGKYCEHAVSIRHARFIHGNPLAVSVDERCCLRIWNYRTLRTHQIIDGDRLFSSQCQLLVVPQLDSFYIAERKITEFKSVSFFKRAKQINHRPLDFHYNSYLGSFWMFTSSDARHYDSLNGRLRQLLTNLSDPKCEFVVTAVEFGPKCRKLYIGDAGGFLREYSTETGEFIQELRPLEDSKDYQQVRKILYVKEEDLVLCASIDGRILVFSRNECNEYVLVRDLRGSHTTDLTGMCYSEEYHLMASSCEGGTINIWNSVKYMLETVLVAGQKIIDIRFVRGYPVLLACCELGQVLCFGVRPIEESMRHRCIFKIVNQQSPQSPLRDISCFDAATKQGSLQLGLEDDSMNKVLDVNGLHVLVAIGENTGTASTLCLDQPFKQFGVVRNERIEIEEPSHPRRYDHCYIDKQVQSFLNRKSLVDARTNCPTVTLAEVRVATWMAHQGALLKIKFQKEPFVVMTGSDDQKFKIFELGGGTCGIVDCQTFKSTYWRMPEVNIRRRLKQIDFVLYIMNLIDGESMSEPQKQRVKAQMLMDRYMGETDRQQFYQHVRRQRQSKLASTLTSATNTPAIAAEARLNQNPTPQQSYQMTMHNLKQRLLSIDKEIAASISAPRLNTPQICSEPLAEKRKHTEPKEIRSFKAKLEAIEQHLPTASQPRQQPTNKEKKPRQQDKHKNCLFVSYGQLKRNLTAMHKMLRINNIR